MAQTLQNWSWKLGAALATLGAVYTAKKLVNSVWRAGARREPPENVDNPRQTRWGEAVLWTAASAATIAVAGLLARRGLAEGWQSVTGELPPSV
ncbi:MAG: DUF4235 domain-containing protein [Acidobacteria bacterium]|nr:DUF4235 domain-containing protein [Acidobacteriota bacterium]